MAPGPLIVPLSPGESPGDGTTLYIISIVMVIISGFVVIARMAAVLTKTKVELGLDDYCICLALLWSVLTTLSECSAVANGYGDHVKDLTHEQTIKALKWFYCAQIFYKMVVTFDKLSILLLYLRIFPHQKFRILCYLGLAFISASCIAFVVGAVFQCTPVAYFWDRTIKGGHCIQNAPWWISYSAINVFTDFYILLLPIPLLLKLSMTKRERFELIGIFAMGAFVCVATIIRITTLASSASGTDATYDPIPATNWSVVEANTGLICACLPMLKRYFNRFFRVIFGGTKTDNNSNEIGGSKYPSRGYHLNSMSSKKDTIFGTDGRWGTVDNTISSNAQKQMTESQENIVDQKSEGIQKTVIVTMAHGDSQADNHSDNRSTES
ncbi:integral membrane protein [Xylogone sp. PMI_703]|nr:integral membrane protein [Xylogone sp. PMI_703]